MPTAAWDLDGTITVAPALARSLVEALNSAGWSNVVITGWDAPAVPADAVEQKSAFLDSIDVPASLFECVYVLPTPHAANKAAKLRGLGAVVNFENRASNAAASACPTFLLWQGLIMDAATPAPPLPVGPGHTPARSKPTQTQQATIEQVRQDLAEIEARRHPRHRVRNLADDIAILERI